MVLLVVLPKMIAKMHLLSLSLIFGLDERRQIIHHCLNVNVNVNANVIQIQNVYSADASET